MIVINIFIVLYAFFITRLCLKRETNALTFAVLTFDAAYVLPIFIEIFMGVADIGYYGFRISLNDLSTNFIYMLFIIVVCSIFYHTIRATSPLKNANNSRMAFFTQIEKIRLRISKSKIIAFVSFLLSLLPIFVLIFSPSPLIYFDIGFISQSSEMLTMEELDYQNNIVKYANYLSFLGVVLYKLYDRKNRKYRKIIRGIAIIIITLLNGKRTFFAFLMIALWIIDYSSTGNERKRTRETIITFFIIIVYFFVYANISGKIDYSNTIYAMISEYFFRSNSVKVAIYSILNQDDLKILEYPLQTIIYDLFFFIPRSIWPSKPYPFPDYYSVAVRGFNLGDLGKLDWKFQTGIYSEFIANFSFWGMILAPLFLIWMAKITNKSKSAIVKFSGIILITLLQVFEYSDTFKVIFMIWLFTNVSCKLKIK